MKSKTRKAAGKASLDPLVVWIVTEDYGQDEGIGIRGVFATKELAEEHKASIGPRNRYRFDIEAHDVITHNARLDRQEEAL